MPSSVRVGRSFLPLLAVALLVTSLLPSCSLSKASYSTCEKTSECRSAFGRGWVCGDAGLCAEVPPMNRCSSHPAGILEDLSSYEDWILLGSIFDQVDFEVMVKAARLAAINVNTRDGLGGTPFGIIECSNQENVIFDDLSYLEATAVAGHYLSDVLGLATIIGPATSSGTEVAFNTDSPLGTLHITPSATSDALTNVDGTTSTDSAPGLLWRSAPPDSLQGRVIAMEMLALGITRVGIVAQVGAYGEGLAEIFQQNFVGDGISSELRLFEEVAELGPLITEFDDPGYEAVLVISAKTSDMAAFLNGASAEELSYDAQKLIFLPDGANDVELIEVAWPASALFDNIRGTVPSTPSGLTYQNFVASYRTQYNGEDPSDFGFSAHAYDAGWLAIAGTAWSFYQEGGEISGIGTARGLRKISDPTAQAYDLSQIDWNSIATSFEEGLSVDVEGASGSLNYDPESGELTAPIDVWVIECEDLTSSDTCAFNPVYCVDLSDAPDSECCTQPGVNCSKSSGGDDDDDDDDDDDTGP